MKITNKDNDVQKSQLKEMDYYLLKEGEEEKEDKDIMFNKWCKKEGVIMPKVEYPVFFENGLRGMRAIEDIAPRETFIFVPFKMVISTEIVWDIEALKPVLSKHPELFTEKFGADYQ